MSIDRRALLVLLLALVCGCSATARPPAIGKVLVVGATGQTGRLVVRELQGQGFTVRAFVRDAEKARRLLGDELEIVTGDVKDPASLPAAMAGMDALISAIGARSATGPDRPEKVDFEGVRNLAQAAAKAGLRHFVLVSSMGVTHEDHPLNKMFGDVLIWKARGEQALRASGVPYTIIRPGGLVNEAGGQGRLVVVQGDPQVGRATVPRADLATVCVAALLYPEASRNKTFELYRSDGEPVSDWQAVLAALAPDPA